MAEIRTGLAANLASLKALGFQVSPYLLANPTPPSIQVMPGEVTYDRAMHRGLDYVEIVVQAYVALSTDLGGQQKLDQLIAPTGAYSIKTLIESDRTLGDVVDDLHVTKCSGYQTALSIEGRGPFLLCEWTLNVMASN